MGVTLSEVVVAWSGKGIGSLTTVSIGGHD